MYLLIKTLLLGSTVAYQVCQSYSLILFFGGLNRRKNEEVLYYLRVGKCLKMELLEIMVFQTQVILMSSKDTRTC